MFKENSASYQMIQTMDNLNISKFKWEPVTTELMEKDERGGSKRMIAKVYAKRRIFNVFLWSRENGLGEAIKTMHALEIK